MLSFQVTLWFMLVFAFTPLLVLPLLSKIPVLYPQNTGMFNFSQHAQKRCIWLAYLSPLFYGCRVAFWSSFYIVLQYRYTFQKLFLLFSVGFSSASIPVLQGRVNCRWESLCLNWRQTRTCWVFCVMHYDMNCWSVFLSLSMLAVSLFEFAPWVLLHLCLL